MRWIFSAMVLLAVVAMAGMAPAGDCCGGGQAGMYGGGMYGYGGGMYGNGLSALSAQACATPIYGWTEGFCPETPRCTGLWDDYCNEQGCRGCGRCRGRACGSLGSDCGTTRAWSPGGTVIEQTMTGIPTSVVETTAVPKTQAPTKAVNPEIRRLPKPESSLEFKLPVETVSADSG